MVGPLLLLKILHCTRFRRGNSTCNNLEGSPHDESQNNPVKNELKDDGPQTCRVCLKDGNIPIYGDDRYEDVAEDLLTITGLEMQPHDDQPKYLCNSCNSLLQGAIILRKTAQQTDIMLKNQPQINSYENDNDYFDNDYDEDDDEDQNYQPEQSRKDTSEGFHCKRCDLDFKNFEEYNEHRMTEEHETKKHQCPYCNKLYNAVYFKRHLALHELDTPYMCDICGKAFIVKGHFTRHRLTHFYNLPYKCSLCPYKGRFSESLKMHMRSHTGEKPYQCTECPSKFISKSNLNKHMLTHKAVHDFKCDSCGRGFYKKRDLDLHFKVDHTGIKDHVCNICGKAFGYRKQMMKHQLKVHKREKLRSGRMPLYLQVEAKKMPVEES